MRTLEAALTAAQARGGYKPAVKIVLTSGETTYTIEEDRIKDIKPFFSLWHAYVKELQLNNSDGYFYDIDLKGYQAVIYRGAFTTGGKLYSNDSQMKVVWQEFDDSPGRKTCVLKLLGIPDLMDMDEANDDYIPASDDATTVKDLLTAIAGATLDCFDHCTAYTIEWDNDEDDDDLLNFAPADSFRIYVKGSRLAAFRRILEYCACGARFENDGKIHILIPTTTGTDYDYEYALPSGHPFLSKAYRDSLVIPNKIVVSSQKDDDPQYTGNATSATSYALLPKPAYFRTRLDSNATATAIAEALLARAEWEAEMGVANSLINCGSEIFDYVKVGASSNEDSARTGNIGWLQWHFNPERGIYDQDFGFGAPPLSRHIKELYRDIQSEVGVSFDKIFANDIYLIDEITLDDLPDGETYSRVLSTHLSAGQIVLNADISYTAGYDPSTKRRTFLTTPTTPYDLGDLWVDATTTKRCTTARASGAYVSGDWTATTLDAIADGTSFHRVQTAALTPAGLVLLDQVEVGTYGLVLSADISAGHILMSAIDGDLDDIANGTSYGKLYLTDLQAGHLKLTTNVTAAGKWYSASGVSISADTGINIWGTANALTTRQYETGTIQCYVGADGAIYAGAGGVKLSASGIALSPVTGYTGSLSFSRSGSTSYIWKHSASPYPLWIECNDVELVTSTPLLRPASTWNGAAPGDLGSAAIKWNNIWVKVSNVGDIRFENKWQLTETEQGIVLLRPDGSQAAEWR